MPGHDVRRLIVAEGISNFGSMLSRLAIPWIASIALSATPAQMAALVAADLLVGALGALWLGPRIDRSSKRRVMRVCDGLRALLLVALALAVWHIAVTMTMLLAAALLSGLLNMAFDLARSAWIAQCVPSRDLPRANASLAAAGSVSETVAFASGGWLYQWAGAVWALLADAASFLASAAVLRGVREAPAVGALQGVSARWRRWWEEQRQAWVTVTEHAMLRTLAVVEGLRAVGFGLIGTSYMVYVSRDLALPTGPQGLLFALGALGALLGAALAPQWQPRRALVWGLALAALASWCVPMAQGAGIATMALIAAQQIIGDAGDTLYDVHDQTLRQTAAPADQRARVDAGLRGIGQLGTLLGAAVGAIVGTVHSPRAALLCGALATTAALMVAAARLSRHERCA